MPDNFLFSTLATFLAWLAAFGVSAAVAYALNAFPQLPESARQTLQVVLVAMLSAGVSAVATQIPQAWLDKTVLEALIFLVSAGVSEAGVIFGRLKLAQGQTALLATVKASGIAPGVVTEDLGHAWAESLLVAEANRGIPEEEEKHG